MATTIQLPQSLRYPVQVLSLAAYEGAPVRKGQTLCTYAEAPVFDPKGKGKAIDQPEVRQFVSPIDGSLEAWSVKAGQSLQDSRYVFRCLLPLTLAASRSSRSSKHAPIQSSSPASAPFAARI